MRLKRIWILAAGFLAAMAINSCKKSSNQFIAKLFPGGTWQLASVYVFHYTGNTQTSVDTLNTDTACHSTQYFTFYSNNTCTYTNFDCLTQSPAPASWSLTQNQLYLQANVVCKDTSSTAVNGISMPFSYARIVNAGEYSLILQTGDVQPNYSLTKPRTITQYGFIRQRGATGN